VKQKEHGCNNAILAGIVLALTAAALYFSPMGLWNFGSEGSWQARLDNTLYGGWLGTSFAGLFVMMVPAAVLAYLLAWAAKATPRQRWLTVIWTIAVSVVAMALWIFSTVLFI